MSRSPYEIRFAFFSLVLLLCACAVPAQVNPDQFKALKWRGIGPYRGGRSTAVAGDANNRLVFYMGATGGGVWKTTDGGISWSPMSDGIFRRDCRLDVRFQYDLCWHGRGLLAG